MNPQALTDTLVLEQFLKWSGVVLALVGTVVTTPSGTRHALHSVKQLILRRLDRVRSSLARFIPFLRRNIHVQVADSIGVTSGTGTVTARGHAWEPNGTNEAKIAHLYAYVVSVEQQLDAAVVQMSQRADGLDARLNEIHQRLESATNSLKQEFSKRDESSKRIDATGLPMLGFGVVLSGVPNELASIPWLGWICFAVGVLILVGLTVVSIRSGAWRERQSVSVR
jgi:hypothetical protein